MQGQQGEGTDDVINQKTHRPGRHKGEKRRQCRLFEHHPHQIAGLVSHSLQSGILRQLVRQIGIDHLIRDQHTNNESNEGTHPEDRPGRGEVGLEIPLERDQLRLAENPHLLGQGGGERLLHGGDVGAGLGLDHAELDRQCRGIVAIAGQEPGECPIAHHHGAVAHEIGAEREAADDMHRPAVDRLTGQRFACCVRALAHRTHSVQGY